MEYVPINSVWEITMACNMRCKHCGSKCTDRQPEELTGKEALQLCDDLAELGLKIVTLSGGEPLTRPDWPSIAKRLSGHGVAVTMISNGWLVDNSVIDKALDSGLDSIGISLDGVEKTHDSIRKKGAFAKVMRASEIMKKRDFPSSIVTTVMKQNLPELPEIKKVLEEKGVKQWQLQIGMPMGNLGENRDNVISPHQLNDIIDFAYTVMKEGKIKAALADNVGYYTNKSVEIAQAEKILLKAAENRLLPRLDLNCNLGYSGLDQGSEFSESISPLYTNVPGLSFSLSFDYEWPVANNSARGILLQKKSAYQQSLISTGDLARNISSGVLVAISGLGNSELELSRSQEAVRSYRSALDNEKKRFQLGISTLLDLIQTQDSLTNALLNEISAQRKLSAVLARLRFETGTILYADQKKVSVSMEELTTIPLCQ